MKNILTALALCATVLTAHAGPIDLETARGMAARHLARPVEAKSLRHMQTLNKDQSHSARATYIFNDADGKGFAIVAADDRLGGVLGYADKGTLNLQDMPEGLRLLLAAYDEAAEALKVDSTSLIPDYAQRPKAKVEPLVKAKWGQGYPYNYYTPRINGTATYTGCVNTAIAQIMSVHQWPTQRPADKPRGEGKQALDYYDWDNIIADYSNAYSSDQGQAVGVLMRDIGIASSTTYGTAATTTNEGYAWMGLEEDFGYSCRLIEKNMLRGGEFLETVYNELSLGCPVLITGSNHAFVYDGYDTNGLVHINWGWSGDYNGYYDINTVANNGAGSGSNGLFYEEQHALLMRPDDGKHDLFPAQPIVLTVNNTKGLSFAESSTTTTGSLSVVLKDVTAHNLTQGAAGTYRGAVGIGLFTADGTCRHIFVRPGATLTWSSYFLSYNLGEDWAINLADYTQWTDGEYYLRPVAHRLLDAEANKWEDWNHMQNGGQVVLHVSGSEVTLMTDDGAPDLHLVGRPEVVAPLYEQGSDLGAIAVRIENRSSHEAYGSVKLTFTGTGAIEGETYTAPTTWLKLFSAAQRDTTQWMLKFYTSYSGTYSGMMKAGTYRMKMTFCHDKYVDTATDYDIDIPEDFLVTVYPSSFSGRITVNNVRIMANGTDAEYTAFHPDATPEIELGMSALAKRFATDTYSTRLRYRIVNIADGTDALTTGAFSVTLPFNENTDLTAATRQRIDLTSLSPSTYEIHVEAEHDGTWIDVWNCNGFRRTFTVLEARPTTFSIVFSQAAWRTLYTDRAYLLPEGIAAYQVNDKGELVQITDGKESDVRIAAGSALLLHATMGTTYIATYVGEDNTATTGRLKGAMVDVTTSAGGEDAYFYKLTYDNEGKNLGFYWGAADGKAFVSPAGHCYLALPKRTVAESRREGFALADSTSTSIYIPAMNESTDGTDTPAAYDLSGRRVAHPAAKGVYIIGRRKVFK